MGYEKQTEIDRPFCPFGHGQMRLKKSWPLKGRGRKSAHKPTGGIVELYECPTCGKVVRKGRKEK